MIDQIRREISRAMSSVRQALRAVAKGSTLTSRVQRIDAEGLAGEALQDMELFQQFGFTSGVPAGSQLIVIPLGGRTSAAVVVATECGSYRFQVSAAGEMAIYNQWGDRVHLTQDRKIHMVAAAQVLVDAPELRVNGKIHATGDITTDANVTAAQDISDQGGDKSMRGMRSTYNDHKHPENDNGGPTNVPNQQM